MCRRVAPRARRRLRILAGLVGLLVLGLAAFGVGVNRLMRDKLESQLDQQLVSVAGTRTPHAGGQPSRFGSNVGNGVSVEVAPG